MLSNHHTNRRFYSRKSSDIIELYSLSNVEIQFHAPFSMVPFILTSRNMSRDDCGAQTFLIDPL